MAASLGAMGIRGRLFLVSVVLMVVVGSLSAAWLRASLFDLLSERIEAQLTRQAVAARVAVEGIDPEPTIAAVDPIADALADGAADRFTIIRADGRVLGDSQLDPADVAGLDNHADRPEVRRALAQGVPASSHRRSATLEEPMVYVAVPYRATAHHGVVRVSLPNSAVAATQGAFSAAVVGAGLAGLAFAVLMSGLASHLASRDLRAMLDQVRGVLASSAVGEARPPEHQPIAGLAGGVRELADRLQVAVAEVASERARLEALLAGMSEAVLALDAEARITLANPAAALLLGDPPPALGQPLVEAVRSPQLVAVARQALDGVAEATDELTLPDGRIVRATARPLPGHEGCVLVLHDMTEIRRLERVRRDFVANVSHELRTPVGIIRANAESLADGALEDPAVAPVFVGAIQRNAERLGALITDLLRISRIEAGRLELELQPVEVQAAVARALESHQDRASRTGRRIEVAVPPGLRVMADAIALEHVLSNLLDNALKYTDTGGLVRVVASPRDQAGVRIAVEDDGPGIPERHRPRVFERFYRVDAGRARQQGGTGLGLAIVKHLAEHMHGRVGLDPRQPRGSVFWIELPEAG